MSPAEQQIVEQLEEVRSKLSQLSKEKTELETVRDYLQLQLDRLRNKTDL